MSHGAAGFAYALAALGTANRSRRVRRCRNGMPRIRTRRASTPNSGIWRDFRVRRAALAVAVVPRCGGHRPCPPRDDEARAAPGPMPSDIDIDRALAAARRAVGPAMPTRSAVARWAASNWSVKRARCSAEAICSSSRPGGCRQSCRRSRLPGATAGARRCRRDSMSGCSVAWPVSATRACAKSTTRCRTCSSGSDTREPRSCAASTRPASSSARPVATRSARVNPLLDRPRGHQPVHQLGLASRSWHLVLGGQNPEPCTSWPGFSAARPR